MPDIIKDTLATKTLEDLVFTQQETTPQEYQLDTDKVNSIIDKLKRIDVNNGYLGISEKLAIPEFLIRKVHKEMIKRIEELTNQG